MNDSLHTSLIRFGRLFFTCALCLGLWSASGQSWRILQQFPLGIDYEIPRNWYVGGVLNPKSCHCTSGTLNSAPDGGINMVIFSSDKFDLDSLQRQSVWGYNFDAKSAEIDSLHTDHFHFARHRSVWREDRNLIVIRLTTTYEQIHYLLYFWGDAETLEARKTMLDRIILSVRPTSYKR